MKCRKVRRLLPNYQDGDLSAEQARLVDAHLDDCSDCSSEVAQLTSVVALVESLGEVEPSADFTQNVLAALMAEGQVEPVEEPDRPLVGAWLGGVGLAVSVLGLVTLAVAWPSGLATTALPMLKALGQSLGVALDVGLNLVDALLLASYTHGPWIMGVHLTLLLLVCVAWKRLKPIELVKRAGTFMAA